MTVDRKVVATVRVGGRPVPLLPVSAVMFGITPESSEELGDKASSAGLLLTLVTVAAPLALLAVAAVPLSARYPRARRLRRPASAASA
ncbi:hypothetical protein SHKM778_43780 [Streptomyces sp. KM77-8]|uniref:Uncharacterized protein n=1 Tax=Streptomyces haneummycinicus TaxID=3074435 RepID=A0AAT9HKW1_9ACTN